MTLVKAGAYGISYGARKFQSTHMWAESWIQYGKLLAGALGFQRLQGCAHTNRNLIKGLSCLAFGARVVRGGIDNELEFDLNASGGGKVFSSIARNASQLTLAMSSPKLERAHS